MTESSGRVSPAGAYLWAARLALGAFELPSKRCSVFAGGYIHGIDLNPREREKMDAPIPDWLIKGIGRLKKKADAADIMPESINDDNEPQNEGGTKGGTL